MRNLFLLIALLGLIGIAFGVLDIVRGTTGPHGLPFSYENSGGPGSDARGTRARGRIAVPAIGLAASAAERRGPCRHGPLRGAQGG